MKFNIKTILGLIVGFALAYLIKQFIFSPPSLDKRLMQTASEFNKTLPVMVDKDTRLDNTLSLPDHVFQYNYTLVNHERDLMDIEVFEDIMREHILKNTITNPDMKTFRDHKVTMAYYYVDKNKEFITKIMIYPKDYIEE